MFLACNVIFSGLNSIDLSSPLYLFNYSVCPETVLDFNQYLVKDRP